MSVSEENPIAQSVANGVTTSFPHSFTVPTNGDIVVKGLPPNAVSYVTYTYGVDYTLTGVGTAAGSVEFLVAPVANTIITRYRRTAATRAIDYQENGDLLAGTLDGDLDRLWLAIQERKAVEGSSVRAPVGESLAELPPAAVRAERLSGFDSEGGSTTYELLAGAAGDAAATAFIQTGSGAVGRTAAAKLRELITPADFLTVAQAITSAMSRELAVRFDASVTLRVPTDVPTLQDAFDHCIAGRHGVKITLEIASGHEMTTGAVVQDGDFGCFEITSVDAVVTLGTWPANTCVLEGRRARMPTWSILLDCEGKNVGGNDGYNLGAIAARENSDFYSTPGSGVINNGSATCANLIVARGSRCTTPEGVFTGAAFRNAWITHTSQGYMELCDLSGAGGANLFVSRASVCYGTGSNFNDSGEEGVLVYRSIFMAVPFGSTIPTFDNNGTYAILAQQASRVILRDRDGNRPLISNGAVGVRLEGGSRGDLNGCDYDTMTGPAIQLIGASCAQARSCTFDTVGGICLATDNGSHLDAASGTFTSVTNLCQANGGTITLNNSTATGIAGTAIYALAGGMVVAASANFQNAVTHGINCENAIVIAPGINLSGADVHCVRVVAGHVNVTSATGTGAGANGISATQGSTVEAHGANFSGAATNGIAATQGSRIGATNANAQKGGSPGAGDCVIATGGIVAFNGGTGGTSTAVNALTAAGIIFQ